MSQQDSNDYWSAPARNFRTSTRLRMQHFLGQATLGYVLEPEVAVHCQKVAQQGSPLKIADLACGNGAWLTSLRSDLAQRGIGDPATTELHGCDINPVYFPHAAWLPPDTTLTQLDILARPLPAHLVGAYDVVHVRAFCSVVVDGDLAPLLSTARALLKPGGLFQWEESRSDTYVIESPSPDVSKTACEGVAAVLASVAASRRNRGDWVDAMDKHMAEHGFEDARMTFTGYRKEDFKAWTENFLAWWGEMEMYFPTKAEKPDAPMAREAWLDLYARAIRETEEGVVVHMGSIRSAVGRKPL